MDLDTAVLLVILRTDLPFPLLPPPPSHFLLPPPPTPVLLVLWPLSFNTLITFTVFLQVIQVSLLPFPSSPFPLLPSPHLLSPPPTPLWLALWPPSFNILITSAVLLQVIQVSLLPLPSFPLPLPLSPSSSPTLLWLALWSPLFHILITSAVLLQVIQVSLLPFPSSPLPPPTSVLPSPPHPPLAGIIATFIQYSCYFRCSSSGHSGLPTALFLFAHHPLSTFMTNPIPLPSTYFVTDTVDMCHFCQWFICCSFRIAAKLSETSIFIGLGKYTYYMYNCC